MTGPFGRRKRLVDDTRGRGRYRRPEEFDFGERKLDEPIADQDVLLVQKFDDK